MSLPDSYYDLPDEPEEEMHGEPEPDQPEEPTGQQCDDQAESDWNRRDR